MTIHEINHRNLKNEIVLKSDLAGQNPLYLFDLKEKIVYSNDINELLEFVKAKLEVDPVGLSFLLKNGVIPIPNTIFKNLYIVSVGIEFRIFKNKNNLVIDIKNEFPFYRDTNKTNSPDDSEILSLLSKATISKINPSKETYMFHSSGKDSNMLALALSESNYKDITFVSHKSEGASDESQVSKSIAEKLGFKHSVLSLPDRLEKKHYDSINDYFTNIPLPVIDEVTLAYPIYNTQLNFKESNIIDGLGNDSYIGYIPNKREYILATYLSKFSFLKNLTNKLNSENYFNIFGLNKIEWTGFMGFMNKDLSDFYPDFISSDKYWIDLERSLKHLSYIELKAQVRGGFLDHEMFMRKVRNFADVNNANLIFPWADTAVSEYVFNLDPKYLYNEKELKNKLFLKKILKDRIGLDSEKLGKLGFTFNYWELLENNSENVENEIINCKLWDKKEVTRIYNRLRLRSKINSRFSTRAKSLIHRLFIISSWYNHNKYINL
jgi:asparagine synthase (glutamine-hydrolysing)